MKVASDSQVADGKLRLRSPPAAFCLVPRQAVRIEHRNHGPARFGGGNPIQQPAHEQRSVRFLAVLSGCRADPERTVALRQEHSQRQVASRAAVLLDAPAVELAPEALAHWTAIRTATSSVSAAVPLKTPRVGGTSA